MAPIVLRMTNGLKSQGCFINNDFSEPDNIDMQENTSIMPASDMLEWPHRIRPVLLLCSITYQGRARDLYYIIKKIFCFTLSTIKWKMNNKIKKNQCHLEQNICENLKWKP